MEHRIRACSAGGPFSKTLWGGALWGGALRRSPVDRAGDGLGVLEQPVQLTGQVGGCAGEWGPYSACLNESSGPDPVGSLQVWHKAARGPNACSFLYDLSGQVSHSCSQASWADWGSVQVKCVQLQHARTSPAELFCAVRPVLHELECSIHLSL